MRISRIYYDGILKKNETVNLPIDASHYILHVLRLKIGAGVILFNGNGQEYEANLVGMEKKLVILKVAESSSKNVESPLKIHLAQAISRGEKMDWVMQKAVELGVCKITPVITDFCSVKLNEERLSKRLAHWKKIIISACEQSGRTTLPLLEPAVSFNQWVRPNMAPLMLFCDPSADLTVAQLSKVPEAMVLIGPEGGLSTQEINSAIKNNFQAVSLGPRILRTETAALAVLSILQNQWGDM